MKKWLINVMAGVLGLGCLMVGAGCSSPKLNIEDAEEALREKGYEVEIEHDVYDSEFGVDGVIKKSLYAERDDMWIEIYELENAKTAKLFQKIIESEMEAEKNTIQAYIEYYEHILDEYKDDLKSDEVSEIEDTIKEYKKELENCEEEEKVLGVNGKYIWHASDIDIIEDAQ